MPQAEEGGDGVADGMGVRVEERRNAVSIFFKNKNKNKNRRRLFEQWFQLSTQA